MPFARDTRSQLREKALADIAARLAGSNPYLRRSVLNVLGLIIADQHADQLGYLDWISRMAVPFTSEDEFLAAWAALKNVVRKPAVAATGAVRFTGTPAAAVPIGTLLARGDGWVYSVRTGGVLDGIGVGSFTVDASFTGKDGNSDSGTPLAVSSTPGINPDASVVAPGLFGAADVESSASLRSRMLEAFANPPQGGSFADYVTWALAVPGVTRAWTGGSEIMGSGSASLFFMMDETESAFGGIPQGGNGVSQYDVRASAASGDQLLVADYIYPLRPVTALLWAMAPTAVPLNLTLTEVPNDTAVRDGITAALAGALFREATPGGVFTGDPNNPSGTLRLSHLDDALAAVPGLDHFIMTSPTADVSVATGHLLVPGAIIYA